ncbi:MAG: type II toxin-antitoxin system YafQ family toxin [Spirochaetes bacterium]|nr:type II toxin-antitoxin system YafQ family toxin [Spirochaetota bacterium]
MIEPSFTNQFVRDVRLMKKQGRNLDDLFDVLVEIIWEEPLPKRNREHNLSGDYSGYTECHVKGDWLIIYRFSPGKVTFVRTGTHSELF